jgi:hypothetical protein
MAAAIVEFLEVVDVEEQQPAAAVVARGARQLPVDRRHECTVVGQTGERIGGCQCRQLRMGGAQLPMHAQQLTL